MNEETPRNRKVVTGYGDGGFRIAGERVEGSVLVFPERFCVWDVVRLPDVTSESLAEVIAVSMQIDILLLGCGDALPIIGDPVRVALKEHAIVIDVMSTGAACRTFNILLSEGRAVAAALIAV